MYHNTMKHLLLVFSFWSINAVFAQAPVNTSLPLVTVSGNKFVAGGNTIIFRGLDAPDPDKLEKDGHWNREYFEAVKSWGANIVRFAVHPRAWRSRPPRSTT